MDVDAINYLNIGLMALSVLLAYLLPFELFIFSYAVLGPLHYLTEIGWLHKRQYFTTGKRDYLLLVGICCLAFLLFVAYKWCAHMYPMQVYASQLLRVWVSNLVVIAFIGAFSMVFFNTTIDKLIFTCTVSGGLLYISALQPALLLLAMLLPTLIHVTLFMVLFILYGAIKGNSVSGFLSVVFFIICCSLFFMYKPVANYGQGNYYVVLFRQSDFTPLLQKLLGNTNGNAMVFSPQLIALSRFLAFAYTYHYLNWFSKTKIIDWYNVPKAWRWFSIITWVACIVLYAIDFKIGLAAVFFLSLLHVMLEFPLNYLTIKVIGSKIFSIFA